MARNIERSAALAQRSGKSVTPVEFRRERTLLSSWNRVHHNNAGYEMFVMLETRTEVAKAQRKLESTLRRNFPRGAIKNIGYPGGTNFDAKVFTNGNYWFWSADHSDEDVPNPRRLNWFGRFNVDGDLQISVEINTAYEGRNDQVAGFFAKNIDTGSVYLMHSGRVGGGTKGVSKTALLTWSNQHLIDVIDASGNIRDGLLVMPIEGPAATRSAVRYIEAIALFKEAVRRGELHKPEFQRKQRELEQFYSEAHGRRKGRRSSRIDYISRHGEVVDALHAWRNARPMPNRARIVKNVLIDMGVATGQTLLEVFDVKTSVARQDVYTAIGQLMVHGKSDDCRRVMVLPRGETIAPDLVQTLHRLNVELLRFEMDENSVTIKP